MGLNIILLLLLWLIVYRESTNSDLYGFINWLYYWGAYSMEPLNQFMHSSTPDTWHIEKHDVKLNSVERKFIYETLKALFERKARIGQKNYTCSLSHLDFIKLLNKISNS